MKQIIETITQNRKAVLIAAGTVVLLLCILVAVPFTAAALGKGLLPEETEPTGVEAQVYADTLAEQKRLAEQTAQQEETIRALQEENRVLSEALAQAQEQNEELLRQITQAEEALLREQERFGVLLSRYSRKYVVIVKVVQDHYLWVEDDGKRYEAYLSEEEYHQIEKGDVLDSCPGLDIPSTGRHQIIVVNKYIAELEELL